MHNTARCVFVPMFGANDGGEGVKLEQQVLIADSGVEILSNFPLDDDLVDGCA